MFESIADLDRARQCVNNSDPQACAKIGFDAARAAGVPLPLSDRMLQQGSDCVLGKNQDACVAIGTEAAKAAGVPLNDLDSLRRCATGDVQFCAILASQTTGLPLARIEDVQQVAISVSGCVNANVQECQALAFAAIKRYGDPKLAEAMNLVNNLPDKGGLGVARASNDLGWLPKHPPAAAAPPVVSAIPTVPRPRAGASFAGQWMTTVQNGVAYTIRFTQDAAGHVSGTYDSGTISDGVVVGADLYAHWSQAGATGTLRFSLAGDHAAFAGMWTLGEKAPTPASANGTWDGYRKDVFTGSPDPGSFAGTWMVTRGSVSFPIELEADGASITATYSDGVTQGGLSGTPIRRNGQTDVLSFKWDEQSSGGIGAFYLYPNGQRISGILHTSDKALGTWTAVRAVPLAVQTPPPVASPPAAEPPPAAQAPVVKLPRGACPGPEAVATQDVTVRDGKGGTALKPALQGGTLVSCLACDQSWCLIANVNPHATVSRKYLDFDFAVAQQPVQQPVDEAPAPRPKTQRPPPQIADFSGEWHVTSDKGWNYHITISQHDDGVTATFIDQAGLHGAMSGGANGNVFNFNWGEDGGYAGNGAFAMSGDGTHIDGGYQVGVYPVNTPQNLLTGRWSGTRGFRPFPTPAPAAQAPVIDNQIDYGGCGGCGQPEQGPVVK